MKLSPVLSRLASGLAFAAATLTLPVRAGEPSSAMIPLGEIGAKATADYSGEALGISNTADGAEMHSGFQRLTGKVTCEGLTLVSTEAGGGSLHLGATGLGENELPTTGEVKVGQKVVAFSRPGLVEEYSVSVDGVRQDFVVLQKPAGPAGLTVSLALSGARAEASGSGVRLVLAGSHRALVYGRLKVADAAGRELAARIAVESPDQLSVRVEDAGAVYPVRIDPTFSDADWVGISPGGPSTDLQVYALASDGGGNLYLGGAFTVAGGVQASRVVKWNGSNWSAMGSGLNGTVRALAVSGSAVYAGGTFTKTGLFNVSPNIARWNGTAWSSVGSGCNGAVASLAVNGADLYAGGSFTTAGGVSANRVAKWSGSAWSVLGAGLNSAVSALAVSGGSLYAGGLFTTAGGASADHVARWDGTAWAPLGAGVNGEVRALAVTGAAVYAGGVFTTAGGGPANSIAKWDGASWSPLGAGLGTINSLAVSGADLYAGGLFTTATGAPSNHVARWDGAVWSGLGAGAASEVYVLSAVGGRLYAGANFTSLAGPAGNIGKWENGEWSALSREINGSVWALAMVGTDLYMAGEFTVAGGPANRIAKWNGTAWSAVGSGLDGAVRALAVRGTDLYVGGEFTTAGGVPASRVAKWDGSAWSALGTGMDGTVWTLSFGSSTLYAGGAFTTAGGMAAGRVAKWNGSDWAPLGSGLNAEVRKLAVLGADVYAGAANLLASGQGLAKWDGNAWTAVGTGYVTAVTASAPNLYVGGLSLVMPGTPPTGSGLVKWDGASWSVLAGNTSGQRIEVVTVVGSELVAVGDFDSIGGVAARRIARWNGAAWSSVGQGIEPGNGLDVGYPLAMLVDNANHLFVGGVFVNVGNFLHSPNIAQANLSLLPEIGVEQPVGTALADGVSTVSFGSVIMGAAPVVNTFTVRNTGCAALTGLAVTKNGANAAEFALGPLGTATLEPQLSTTFTVSFSPVAGASGTRSAALHIASNVAGAANPFDINLSATALSATLDADGDGLNDAAEFQLAALGFNWQVNQASLVSTLFANAKWAGLSTAAQVQALKPGLLLVPRNPATGFFTLQLGLEKSTDLEHFTPFPFVAPQTSVNGQGKVEFQFMTPDDAMFFRVGP